MSNGDKPGNNNNDSAGHYTKQQASLCHSTNSPVLLFDSLGFCYAFSTGKVEAKIDESLGESHERHNIRVDRITLRQKHTCQIRQCNEGKNVLNNLQSVLPNDIAVETFVLRTQSEISRRYKLDKLMGKDAHIRNNMAEVQNAI